jgi:hypothetical protein
MPEPLHQPPLAPTRDPYPSEVEWFRSNPTVGGYASFEDGHVVVNPFNQLTPEENQALIELESSRLFMHQQPSARPTRESFPLTEQQRQTFGPGGTLQYRPHPAPADPEQSIRETIASRMLVGDPSAGTNTQAQEKFLEELRARMLSRRR